MLNKIQFGLVIVYFTLSLTIISLELWVVFIFCSNFLFFTPLCGRVFTPAAGVYLASTTGGVYLASTVPAIRIWDCSVDVDLKGGDIEYLRWALPEKSEVMR